MKKIMVVLMVFALSVASFAYGGKGEEGFKGQKMDCARHEKGFGQEMRGKEFKRELDVQILKKLGVSEENIAKAVKLTEASQKEAEIKRLDIEEKEIELKREMLQDNKNWSAIERIIEEISDLKAKQHIKRLKTMDSLEKLIPMDEYRKLKREEKRDDRKEFRGEGQRGEGKNKNRDKNKK